MLVDLNTSKIDFRGPLVVLHRPQIPQNTGNIARLCVAIQSPLIITGRAGFDFSERAVRRAGLDHWNHLAFSHFPRFKDFYKKFGEHRLVAVTKAATRSALTFDYTPNDILLFGNETMGLPPVLLKKISCQVALPMSGRVRSLNLSNSVAVVAYAYIAKIFPDAMHPMDTYPRTHYKRKMV